jgi:hypothetical protein
MQQKGKGKVENWRQRPVRSGVFQRTLPGELSRAIIVARKVPSAATGNSKDSCCPQGLSDCEVQMKRTVNAAMKIFRETEGLDVHLLCAKTRTWNRVKAARKTIKETECSPVPLLRGHPSFSLARHTQVANVIAKCLPLQSVESFLCRFNSCRPPPLQRQKKQKRKRKKHTTVSLSTDTMASVPAPGLALHCCHFVMRLFARLLLSGWTQP